MRGEIVSWGLRDVILTPFLGSSSVVWGLLGWASLLSCPLNIPFATSETHCYLVSSLFSSGLFFVSRWVLFFPLFRVSFSSLLNHFISVTQEFLARFCFTSSSPPSPFLFFFWALNFCASFCEVFFYSFFQPPWRLFDRLWRSTFGRWRLQAPLPTFQGYAPVPLSRRIVIKFAVSQLRNHNLHRRNNPRIVAASSPKR